MITQERLRQIMTCDPVNGQLFWKRTGKEAGCRRHDGYVIVGVDKKLYLRHRLIWLFVHGALPKGLDHANCIKGDDRIENLRPAEQAFNGANVRKPANNKSGAKGVHWHPQSRKWRVQIGCRKNREHVGMYTTVDEAASAYADAARRKYGPFARLD